jgi:hypothetical protein
MAGYLADFAFSCYDFYHGPEAPGAGWQLVGEGPRGGKLWAPPDERKEAPRPPSQDKPPTPKNRLEDSSLSSSERLADKVKQVGGSAKQASEIAQAAKTQWKQQAEIVDRNNSAVKMAFETLNQYAGSPRKKITHKDEAT